MFSKTYRDRQTKIRVDESILDRLPSFVSQKATLLLKTLNDTTLLASLRSLNANRTCVNLKEIKILIYFNLGQLQG